MSLYKELSYDNDFDTIKGIQFCIMSPEDIQKRSVAEIYKSETYNGTEPVLHGLFDPRMGVIDHNKLCVTCHQRNTFCPGHFGHINLAKPVFYIQFFGMVKNLLKCVCFRCSKLLVDPEDNEIKNLIQKKCSRQKRWETIYKLSQRIKRCGMNNVEGCGAKQPTITKEGMLKIGMEWRDAQSNENNKKIVLSAEDVLKIFMRISDRDAEILGFSQKFNRPEYMICTVLPVPPPAVRPSVRNDTGQRSEDDLTHKLLMIIKTNNTLKQKIEKSQKEQIDMITMVLQYDIATLIDNTIPGIPPSQQRTGRPIRSLTERLKSKEGRIRGNLMGKRVDFSARSVITPDPNISIDELGVPIKIAMNLTYPVIVNKYNRDEMTKLVKNGPDIYPGAKYVRKTKEHRTIRLRTIDRAPIADMLEDGDIVERHLLNGDYVLFNRQPSLHKMSMMSHRVRVMPFNTFRLNVMVTPSFNADFDGDEMNMHVPQSLQTHEELLQLSAVPTQIISPRECKPIVSVVQDIALGIYRITKSNVRLSEKQFFNLLALNPNFTGFISGPKYQTNKGTPLWSGRQLLSTIIPKKINVEMHTSSFGEKDSKEDDTKVIIRNGEILSGRFDKDVYQARTKGLVHSIFNEYGSDDTRIFFDNTQKIICSWFVLAGASVGISDLIVDAETQKAFRDIINEMKVKVYDIIKDVHTGNHKNNSIKNNNMYFEKIVNDLLNQANRSVGEKGLEQVDENNNRLINMIKSKSKGNTINVAQIIGCLGQQNVDGARIPYGFDDRTLPHYNKFDDGPESRGFVENSFIKGLTPSEFFFHAMGGREGLIDTACQTSTIGYVQRKLVKAMEDCKVNYDLSVRNATGSIIQFLYGDDGMDATKIESQHIPYIDMDLERFLSEYKFSDTLEELKLVLRHDIYDKVKKESKWRHDMEKHLEQVMNDRNTLIYQIFKGKLETTVMYPVSLNRLINITKGMYSDARLMLDLEPSYILQQIDQLCEHLFVNHHHKGNGLFHILLRAYLSPKIILLKHRFPKDAFDYIIHQIRAKYFESLAHPSEMVGVVAAQSLGEPATQLSVVKDTRVKIIGSTGNAYNGPIGQFIDKLLLDHKNSVVDLGNKSVVLDLVDDFYVVGVSENEKTSWRRISQVSRHPANGGLVKVTTASGKSTTCTLSHSFLVRSKQQKIVPIRGSDLKCGDYLPIAKYIPTETFINEVRVGESAVALEFELGWFTGIYIMNGTCNNEDNKIKFNCTNIIKHKCFHAIQEKFHFENVSSKDLPFERTEISFNNHVLAKFLASNFGSQEVKKGLPGWVYQSPMEFIKGMLSGFFDSDQNMFYLNSILYASASTNELVDDFIVLLTHLGVFAKKATLFEKSVIMIDNVYALSLRDNLRLKNEQKQSLLGNITKESTIQDTSIIPNIGTFINDLYRTRGWITNMEDKEHVCRDKLKVHIDYLQWSMRDDNSLTIDKLVDAYHANVYWDEIVDLEYLDDPQDFVYDFTVPGNDSFMVDCGVLVHNTLNTFHMSGVSSASSTVRGVPRLEELLRVSKNIKTAVMKIYFKEDYKRNQNTCNDIINDIRTIRFKDIVKVSEIYFDPNEFNTNIKEDNDFVTLYKEFLTMDSKKNNVKVSPWLLRFELDKMAMLKFSLDMIQIHQRLVEFYNEDTISCVFSDDNADKLIFRIKLRNKDSDDALTELKALETNILENVIIKGVKNIERIALNRDRLQLYNPVTCKFEESEEWMAYTDGTNLRDILRIDSIDACKTITNDVVEIYEVFGIEAARQALFNEINDVLDSVYVNYRHIALLVDVQTNKGHIMSIDRHGINRGDIGPLAKCSFEETTDKLIKAGIFAEFDKINGVSANIMLGQIAPCGTGDAEVLIDESKILNTINDSQLQIDDDSINERETIERTCDALNFKFDFDMPPVVDKNKKERLQHKLLVNNN